MLKTITKGCEPTKGSQYAACIDLKAAKDITIGAGETVLIPLGVKIDEDFVYKLPEVDEIRKMHKYLESQGDNPENWKDVAKGSIEDFKISHYLQLMLRSSLSKELIIANGIGIVDLDYKDEIMIRVHNPKKTKDIFFRYQDCDGHIKDRPLKSIPMVLNIEQSLGQYRNEVHIKKGQRVAQITLLEHKSYLFGVKTDNERTGGFGSTGKD